jgi:hypothetical protein
MAPAKQYVRLAVGSIINVLDSKYPNIDAYPTDPDRMALVVPIRTGIFYLIWVFHPDMDVRGVIPPPPTTHRHGGAMAKV